MPKATDTHTISTAAPPSRRGLLAGAASALAAGAAVTAAAVTGRAHASPGAAGDDAELLRLCAHLTVASALIDQIDAEPLTTFGTQESEDREARMAAVDAEWWDLAEEIGRVPALTAAGMRAKARATTHVAARCVCVRLTDTIDDIIAGDVGNLEDRLALSLARDVLAGSAVA